MGVIDAPNYQYPVGVPALASDLGTIPLGVKGDSTYAPLRVERAAPGVPGLVVAGSAWQAAVAPAAATLATLTIAAPGVNRRIVLTSLTATYSASAAPAANVKLITVSSGGTLWVGRMAVDAKAGAAEVLDGSPTLIGAVNTAMVLAFDAAGPSSTFQTLAANGYVVTV